VSSLHNIVRRPLVTEKTSIMRDEENQVVFEVDRGANKIEIRRAIETLFKVRVLDVRTMVVRGKLKRVGRNVGRQTNWKKAVVTLAEGDSIDLFEGV